MRPLQLCVYFLSGYFPRDPHQWVFGSWHGNLFVDNTAALFLYCARLSDDTVRPIWITTSKQVLNQVHELGFEAYHALSLRGIFACLTAGVFIFVGTSRDINHWLSRKANLVLLRHGAGIKTIGRGHENPSHRMYQFYYGNRLQRAFWRVVMQWHTIKPDLVLATSQLHAEQAVEYFGITPDRIMLTGFPRNDVIFEPTRAPLEPELRAWVEEIAAQGWHLFFYMPTFRDDGTPPFSFSWDDFDQRLGRVRAKLLVRFHPGDTSGTARRLQKLETCNIKIHEPLYDAYRAFNAVEALITDYSSVGYDFMLTKKPIIYLITDLEKYKNLRKMYLDYDDVSPGPKVHTLDELEDAMDSVIKGNSGVPQEVVDRVADRFHVFRDAGSSERVYSEIRRRFVDA